MPLIFILMLSDLPIVIIIMTGMAQGKSKRIWFWLSAWPCSKKLHYKYNFRMLFISVLLFKNGIFYPRKLNVWDIQANALWFLDAFKAFCRVLDAALCWECARVLSLYQNQDKRRILSVCICLVRSRVLLSPEFLNYLL